jgi:hypothetical protein
MGGGDLAGVAHVAERYALVMSGPLGEIFAAGHRGYRLTYEISWTLPHPESQYGPDYYNDLNAWFAANPRFDVEDAFLHSQHPRTKANRLLTPIEPHNPWWHQPRWVMNPADPGYRAYLTHRWGRHITGTAGAVNGIFIDEHSREIWMMDGSVELTQSQHRRAIGELCRVVGEGLPAGSMLMLNTGPYHPSQLAGADWPEWRHCQSVHMESSLHYSLEAGMTWGAMRLWQSVGMIVKPTSNTGRAAYDADPAYPPGNHLTAGHRGQVLETAVVLLGATDLALTAYSPGLGGGIGYVGTWHPVWGVEVGAPLGPRQEGPHGSVVREFARGLVVARPTLHWVPAPDFGDSSAVTVPLPPGTWNRVLDDGTLEAPRTSISLRMGEAAIFVRGF